MKISPILFLLLAFSLISVSPSLPSASAPSDSSENMEMNHELLSKAALGSAIVGAALIAVPPLSWLGLALGIVGLGLGIFTRRKAKKKLFSNLVIILGSGVLAYFLAVVGLVLFY